MRDPNPVVVLENEIMYGTRFPMSPEAMSPDFVLPIGKAKIERAGQSHHLRARAVNKPPPPLSLSLSGEHLTIVTFSRMVGVALEAARELEGRGVSCEVINLRTLRPLDRECVIESVKKTHYVMSVEGGWPQCGIGSEIAALIMESEAFDYLDGPLLRVTGADVPMPYAHNLELLSIPQTSNIVTSAVKLLGL